MPIGKMIEHKLHYYFIIRFSIDLDYPKMDTLPKAGKIESLNKYKFSTPL